MLLPSEPIVFVVHVCMKSRVHEEKYRCIVHDRWVQTLLGTPRSVLIGEAHHEADHIQQVHDQEVEISLST